MNLALSAFNIIPKIENELFELKLKIFVWKLTRIIRNKLNMSEPSIEYNLGTLGYSDTVDLGLLAYPDGRAYFYLVFNSNDSRRKSLDIILTDYTFSVFYELLLNAEVQINKLLTSNKMSALALPQNSDVHFRSNLGSVDYDTRQMSVALIIMKDGIGCLRLSAQDMKGRSNGFGVFFDDNEFTKLKSVVNEASATVIKQKQRIQSNQPNLNAQQNLEVRNINFITFTPDGDLAALDVRNAAEAHLALKEIPLIKKELLLKKREIDEKIRCIRSNYTDQQRRKLPKFRGGGWFGNLFRTYQTTEQHNQKFKMAVELEPLEKQKNRLEGLIIKLNRYVLEIDKIMSGQQNLNV